MHTSSWKKRVGKTAKDRASGQASRNEANKKARAAWQQDNNASKVFPKTACNGKKNLHRHMSKGSNYVVHA